MPEKYWAMTHRPERKETDVTIYGDITSWPLVESDVSSYGLARQLQDVDAEKITVHINSYGGEVAEGFAIYNALKNHKATVQTVCDGFACSAASVVFMAGDERVMNPTSLLMIHNASTAVAGTADELEKAAKDLRTITEISATAYKDRVSLTDEELRQMMDEETWITPDQAMEYGFATAIAESEQDQTVTQSARQTVFDRITGAAKKKATPKPVHKPEPEPEPAPEPEPEPEKGPATMQRFFATFSGRKE